MEAFAYTYVCTLHIIATLLLMFSALQNPLAMTILIFSLAIATCIGIYS